MPIRLHSPGAAVQGALKAAARLSYQEMQFRFTDHQHPDLLRSRTARAMTCLAAMRSFAYGWKEGMNTVLKTHPLSL